MPTLATLPSLPGAVPLQGHGPALRAERLKMFERGLGLGPLVRLNLYGRTMVLVNGPEAVHELLVERAKETRKSPGLKILLSHLAGEGLFMSEGDLWRRQRRLMAPLFQPANIGRYAEVMTRTAHEVAAGWPRGTRLDLSHEMTRITMMIVGRTLFGAEGFSQADDIGQAISTLLAWVNDSSGSVGLVAQVVAQQLAGRALQRLPFVTDAQRAKAASALERPLFIPGASSPKLKAALQTLERRLGELIAERRANPSERDDLLTRLLGAQDQDGSTMSDEQLRNEAATLFVAGHETTANALSWSLALLARHPEWMAKLQAEVATLEGRAPTFHDVARMPIAQRVFKEALRLYPPLTVLVRQALEPITLQGVELPARQVFFIPIWTLHRDAQTWPNPNAFDPDRFSPEREAGRHRAAWLPFGIGPRVCIGNHFAMLEGPLVLTAILQAAQLEVETSAPLVTEDFATLRPKDGIWARVSAPA